MKYWKKHLSLISFSMLCPLLAQAALITSEDFYYPHGTVLSGGLANGGAGWSGGWDAVGDDGLSVIGAQMDQSSSGASSRLLGSSLSLGGIDVYYFAFLLRTDVAGDCAFQLQQSATGEVHWEFARNSDGSFSVESGDVIATSDVGLLEGGREYLVVSKFESSGGIVSVKLFDTSNPGAYTTEPSTWDLVADGGSPANVDELKLDVSKGRVAVDCIRIATTYAEAVPALTPQNTFVYKVDQPVTADAKEWIYTVDDAGDYQIGMAWVEAQSGGDVALEVFKNGSERIKGLYASVGEVTRFEMRLEDLLAGDEITVKLAPNDSTYRVGYQIALGTPTFEGLSVFDVGDYGAVGDGVTDDMAAIRAAVTDARHAGGGVIRFDGSKIYRPTGQTNSTVECLFDFYGASNIKIEGNGATILLHPPDSFAELTYCENIQIDGLKVDYDPLPYYQGTITDINVNNLTIDIDVPERYPEPAVGVIADQDQTKLGPFFGRSFIPDAVDSRSGRGENIYVESTALINGDPRKVRIQVPTLVGNSPMKPRVQDAFDNNATEFVVPDLLYGHRNGQTKIYNSSRVTFSNLHFVCMSYFWLGIQHNVGPITLSNVDLKMDNPETELLASWRDGMHIKNGRWGILIEDGDWDGAAQYDDTFAIYTRRQVVVSSTGNHVTLKPSVYNRESFLWQPGDWASFWTPDQGTLRGMARVVSKRDLTSPNYEITFESLPDGVSADDVVLLEECLNRGTLVRHCTTSDIGTEEASNRLRGTGMRFENNHFEDFTFLLEWGDAFGTPRVRDLVVENCYFSAPDGYLKLVRPVNAIFKDCVFDGLAPELQLGAGRVYFDGNAWINKSGKLLNVTGGSRTWLFGDSTRNGHVRDLSSYVSKDTSSTVMFSSPFDYPTPVPVFYGPADFFNSLDPVADVYLRDGAPSGNFGTEAILQCKYDAGGSFSRQSYLRFDVSELRGRVTSAVLRLKAVAVNGTGGAHTVHFVDDNNWGETTLSWSNRPVLGAALDSNIHGLVGEWVEFDVTDALLSSGADLLSLAVVSDGSGLISYGSRESDDAAPQLRVQTSWDYGAWASQYQLELGPDGDDDLDGVSNLAEYAFGGDPTDVHHAGSKPSYGFTELDDIRYFSYVHPQRSTANSGLRYSVQYTDNLSSENWTTVEMVETSVDALEPGLDLVNNRVPSDGESQLFMRLQVEEE